MAQALPVEGEGPSELARVVELAATPRDRETATTEVWPTPDAIVVLRRASLPNVPCNMRYVNRASCLADYVQRVAWDGEAGAPVELDRPAAGLFWRAFAPTCGSAPWAGGGAAAGHGLVGRYAADATRPDVAMIEAEVDVSTTIVAVTGGVVVFPSDGSAWLADGGPGMHFARSDATPPPLVLRTRHGGAARGIEDEALGSLSVTGSAEEGFTSRLSPADGSSDVLHRLIDARSRVREIADLRALRSGRAVALLARASGADALVITPDFGRTWLPAR